MRGRRGTQTADIERNTGGSQLPELKRNGTATKRNAPSGNTESETQVTVDKLKDGAKDKDGQTKIRVNRAPVLTLWVAVVAHREGYKFEEGLSFGKAIAGMLAQSKGRSLGIYGEPDETKAKKKRKVELETFDVFGMSIPAKRTPDGLCLALQSGRPIQPSTVEGYVRNAFGPDYKNVQAAMEFLANSYSPQEIGGTAYSLYEKFRPSVPYGVKGWGAKGVLDIDVVKDLTKQ